MYILGRQMRAGRRLRDARRRAATEPEGAPIFHSLSSLATRISQPPPFLLSIRAALQTSISRATKKNSAVANLGWADPSYHRRAVPFVQPPPFSRLDHHLPRHPLSRSLALRARVSSPSRLLLDRHVWEFLSLSTTTRLSRVAAAARVVSRPLVTIGASLNASILPKTRRNPVANPSYAF